MSAPAKSGEARPAIRPTDRVLTVMLRTYKLTASPLFMSLGARCRHAPSCSEYAVEAVRTHGWARGTQLAMGRLLRCRPGGTSGWDPVPPRQGGAAQCCAEQDSSSHA